MTQSKCPNRANRPNPPAIMREWSPEGPQMQPSVHDRRRVV